MKSMMPIGQTVNSGNCIPIRKRVKGCKKLIAVERTKRSTAVLHIV